MIYSVPQNSHDCKASKSDLRRRAENLFADGYRVEVLPGVTEFALVTTPAGKTYRVELIHRTCNCPAFQGGRLHSASGQRICKHTTGVLPLLADQAAYFRSLAAVTRNKMVEVFAAGGARRGSLKAWQVEMLGEDESEAYRDAERLDDEADRMYAIVDAELDRRERMGGERRAA